MALVCEPFSRVLHHCCCFATASPLPTLLSSHSLFFPGTLPPLFLFFLLLRHFFCSSSFFITSSSSFLIPPSSIPLLPLFLPLWDTNTYWRTVLIFQYWLVRTGPAYHRNKSGTRNGDLWWRVMRTWKHQWVTFVFGEPACSKSICYYHNILFLIQLMGLNKLANNMDCSELHIVH